MRVFQNIFIYPSYSKRFDAMPGATETFAGRVNAMRQDSCNAVHLLEPVLAADESGFLTSNADSRMQRLWAREHGMASDTPLDTILVSQVEEHRAEVFYTQDPAHYGPDFLRRLPGSVRRRVCWQSPPADPGDLRAYDLVLNNFPTSLAMYASQGVRTAYFTPSHDPAMLPYGDRVDRPIDVVFAGGYSRYHRRRAALMERIAELHQRFKIVYALDRSRLTRLAESPLGRLLPLAKHRRPQAIRRVSAEPVFGRALYDLFSRAKIVLNGAVDSAGPDRGNMRCFEAMGCGALMISDEGEYPAGMTNERTMLTYRDDEHAIQLIESMLRDQEARRRIAAAGLRTMREDYAKSTQWQRFQNLLDN